MTPDEKPLAFYRAYKPVFAALGFSDEEARRMCLLASLFQMDEAELEILRSRAEIGDTYDTSRLEAFSRIVASKPAFSAIPAATLAWRLGMDTSTIRRAIAEGRLRAERRGEMYWVLYADAAHAILRGALRPRWPAECQSHEEEQR